MAQRTINAKEILKDIKAGIRFADLMEKYELSERSMKAIYKKLLDSGALTVEELKERKAVQRAGIDQEWIIPSLKSSKNHKDTENLSETHEKIRADMRAGLDDMALMEKYDLAPSAFRKLKDEIGKLTAGTLTSQQEATLPTPDEKSVPQPKITPETKEGPGLPKGETKGKSSLMPRGVEEPPLVMAARSGNYALAEELLHKGESTEERDSEGATALIRAVIEGSVEIVSLLLDWGADIHAKDNSGKTALDWTFKKGRSEVYLVLKSAEEDLA
jgi:hypothetical protein